VGTVVALDEEAVLIVLRGTGRPDHLGGAALLKPARRRLEEDRATSGESMLSKKPKKPGSAARAGVAPVAVVAFVEDRGHAAHHPAGLPIAGEEQLRVAPSPST